MSKGKIIFIILLLGAAVVGAYFAEKIWQGGGLREQAVRQAARVIVPEVRESDLLEKALGLGAPRTYLLLFLNNTELRPGGGFIGAYAIVRMDKGEPNILKMEGTESLDNGAKTWFAEKAPEPITKYLKVNRWWFRDSNWSPDFALSAQKSLEIYRAEKGEYAWEVDVVVGITPTLFEEILRISGPVTVNGIEFTAENFTEKLEYEVEYGYAKRGIPFSERKNIMGDLARSLSKRAVKEAVLRWSRYAELLPRLVREKHLMVYSSHDDEQKIIDEQNLGGKMAMSKGDYLLWVDSNLGALKTDVVLDRSIIYDLEKVNGVWMATATMKIGHNGKFNWRTSRYLDYARVFVPSGSRLVKATGFGGKGSDPKAQPAEGEENGRHWFGSFFSVEPGQEKIVSFTYILPPMVGKMIEEGKYGLLIQKQLGTIRPLLTVRLNFGKEIKLETPAETNSKNDTRRYEYNTDLKEDKEFEIGL